MEEVYLDNLQLIKTIGERDVRKAEKKYVLSAGCQKEGGRGSRFSTLWRASFQLHLRGWNLKADGCSTV
ncbi:hypothetical protein V1478_008077 [Vespula squamosa]|uniref:Uncharacterized protein n=1 Tax=Vespula squamosa TaxID=30214 RepID=A0ABD2AXR6_VESSQ